MTVGKEDFSQNQLFVVVAVAERNRVGYQITEAARFRYLINTDFNDAVQIALEERR